MRTINPYLNFAGNTEAAFNFYKSVFGGEFFALQRFRDIPGMDNIPDSDKNKIMHISLPIGKNTMLMATDALESMGQRLTHGNNFYLTIEAEDRNEADILFSKLSDGGTVEMEMQDTFWGAYFGSFADKFGIQWMITFTYIQ